MQHLTRTAKTSVILPSAAILSLSAAFVFSASALADEVTGKIDEWSHGKADVITGFMEPRVVGQVDADGTVRIPLTPDFTQNMIEETEAQNAGDSEWSVSMRTAGEAWGCDTGDLEVSNADRFAANLSTMGAFMLGSMEQEVEYGTLMIAGSRAFAESYDPFSADMTPGWYVDWVHAETDITISGDCEEVPMSLPEISLERVTSYQIELAPGWNILKHEIEEVYEDESGRIWPTRSSYSTLETLPDDAEFVFISEED